MFLLKAQWMFLGLKAPVFSWVVSVCLIVYSVHVYRELRKASKNRQRALAIAEKKLASLRGKEPAEPGRGISRRMYDALASVFDDLPLLRTSWQAISSCIVVTDRGGEGGFFISEDVGKIMGGTRMIEDQSYGTAPTVISGVGLLATFLAILVALLDVRLTHDKVQGLDLLVQGLSGKFLSSVVAVACATMLIHVEKGLSRPVLERIASFTGTLRSLLPRIVQTQVLSDLYAEVTAQSRMMEAFNIDLFGSTRGQFALISESLSKVIALLQQMNDQLAVNEHIFNNLVNLENGAAAGDGVGSKVEHLTDVVSELTEKLEEHTGASTGSIEKTLAAITVNISDRVMDLSTQIAAVIEETSERSTSRVKDAIEQAGSLSSQGALHLAQLFERHSAELTKVEELRTLLDSTIKGFIASIDRYGRVTEDLQKVAAQVNTGVAALSQTSKSIRESGEAASRVSLAVSSQIESAKDFTQNQKEAWERIEASMHEYGKVFGTVEDHAGDLLAQIARHLEDYSGTTEKHFFNLSSVADNLISQATERLSASIDELAEQLDELHASMAGMARISRAAV